MNVLLLSPYGLNLEKTIKDTGDGVFYLIEDAGQCEIAVMYGYRDILRQDVIDVFRRGVINIHTSVLPYGRGANPNLWGWLNEEPHGVSIHYVPDEGVDTGPIIATTNVEFTSPERETLNSSYMALHDAAERLFQRMWPSIRNGGLIATPQIGAGSRHFKRDLNEVWPLLSRGWDTPCSEVIQIGRQRRGLASNAMDAVGSGRVARA